MSNTFPGYEANTLSFTSRGPVSLTLPPLWTQTTASTSTRGRRVPLPPIRELLYFLGGTSDALASATPRGHRTLVEPQASAPTEALDRISAPTPAPQAAASSFSSSALKRMRDDDDDTPAKFATPPSGLRTGRRISLPNARVRSSGLTVQQTNQNGFTAVNAKVPAKSTNNVAPGPSRSLNQGSQRRLSSFGLVSGKYAHLKDISPPPGKVEYVGNRPQNDIIAPSTKWIFWALLVNEPYGAPMSKDELVHLAREWIPSLAIQGQTSRSALTGPSDGSGMFVAIGNGMHRLRNSEEIVVKKPGGAKPRRKAQEPT
ncbi:uncharacterized protein RSE6_12945 [Rhynchosporium secalis]|uniref:Uncharacterized protein n=1 Tax=Rhynchosporium secalis TaxID=38038 RepID=A0A1E1MSH3_RHYSE|nr:uncharacterized protein RSE6_12945 [Rhynchosporium secalis]